MKKRLISLILILALCLSAFVGCGGGGVVPGGGGVTPGDGDLGGDDGDLGDDGGDDGDEGGDDTIALPDDVETLIASHNRLENADLSFSFDVSSGEKPTYYKTPKMTRKNLSDIYGRSISQVVGGNTVFNITEDDFSDIHYNRSFFESMVENITFLSERAHAIKDNCLDKVIEMDTAFWDGNLYLVMNYDNATETLNVIAFDERPEGLEYYNIKIYYDADGDEVVEMLTVNGISDQAQYIVYAPDKYYEYRFIESFIGGINSWDYTEWVAMAYKEDGYWRGISFDYNLDKPIFKEPGVIYSIDDASIYVDTLYETDYGIYIFNSAVRPRRADGSDIRWDEDVKLADDYYVIEVHDQFLGSNTFIYDLKGMTIGLDYLTGWDNVEILLPTDMLEAGKYYEFSIFERHGTYIELNAADAIFRSDSVYTTEHGIMHVHGTNEDGMTLYEKEIGPEQYEYYTRDDLDPNDAIYISLNAMGHWADPNLMGAITISMVPDHFSTEYDPDVFFADFSKRVGDMLERYGLGFKGQSAYAYGELIKQMNASGVQINNAIFNAATGEDFTVEGICNYGATSKEKTLNSYLLAIEDVKRYEKKEIDYEKLNAYKELEWSLINIGDNIAGNVNISEQNADFSNITITVPKSVMLSKGSSYTVVATLALNDMAAQLMAFDSVEYNGDDMTFVGKGGALLPCTLTEGSYTLYLYLAKVKDDGYVRISEAVIPSVNDFTAFESEYQVHDVYYIASYMPLSGKLSLSVELKDIIAPSLFVAGSEYNAEEGVYVYSVAEGSGIKVSDLYKGIVAEDNKDGRLVVSLGDITKADGEYDVNDVLSDGEVFTVCVSDKAGNVSEVTVRITLYTPVDNENGNGEVMPA